VRREREESATIGAPWPRFLAAGQLVVLVMSLVALLERYVLPGSHPAAAGVAFWVLMAANQVLARLHRRSTTLAGPTAEITSLR
jgi:hypothetical protein